ncbi:conjugative transposon protein TraM [Desertivirga brevis]|uniref:conjugative transposon protein TraM n=1 Tax=Desertivirga brevis TaxID=2810310 RepID=UPI001A96CAF9|nr:conjugative transposon protein TraM [Pedobacter sp. SYSU D00873]
MKIDFKQPRYIIPLIVFPFLCCFFYIYKSSLEKKQEPLSRKDDLQENIADVSDQVKASGIEDKLDAYRNQFRESDGYTAMNNLQEEQSGETRVPDLYNEQEKQVLDSIEKAIKSQYRSPGYNQVPAYSPVNKNVPRKQAADINSHQALARALNSFSHRDGREPKEEPDPMKVFREQMALVDSMSRANDPEYKAELAKQRRAELWEREKAEKKLLPVRKTSGDMIFNTILPHQDRSFITALIDQDTRSYSGSRVRLRLTEDLLAGKFLVPKGTLLYATVSGFSAERIKLSISSILCKDHILPVSLEVYDLDGLPGLYVPASVFREFSRELGGNTIQGVNIQDQVETNSQLVMSLMQKMFQSTSTAVTKLLRQNKAELQYSTHVYLIDPAELKKKQNNY